MTGDVRIPQDGRATSAGRAESAHRERGCAPGAGCTPRNYWHDAVSFDSLYEGGRDACNGVRWKDSVVGYEANLLANTLRLSDRLKSGVYRISGYQVFTIYEPKTRKIVATRIVDRAFQQSLCNAGLYDDITEHFIRDSYACQRNRGTDDAIGRAKRQLERFARLHPGDGAWYLKCDIKSFFASIPHDVAKEATWRHVEDPLAALSVCEVIDSYGDVGMGLGSPISQLVALMVLNPLDHIIKERLGIKCYMRYMDDMILVHESRERLILCKEVIASWLDAHGLQLNNKTTLQPLDKGFWFLQWKFSVTKRGKVLMLRSPKKVAESRRKLRRLWAKELAEDVPPGTTAESMRGVFENLKKGNTWQMRRRLAAFYRDLTGDDTFEKELQRPKKRRGTTGRAGKSRREAYRAR